MIEYPKILPDPAVVWSRHSFRAMADGVVGRHKLVAVFV
jgi:hypothetical protein